LNAFTIRSQKNVKICEFHNLSSSSVLGNDLILRPKISKNKVFDFNPTLSAIFSITKPHLKTENILIVPENFHQTKQKREGKNGLFFLPAKSNAIS
jgi:hypothetical protein